MHERFIFCWSKWNMFIEHKMRAIEFGSLEIGEKRYKIEHRGEWKVGQISIRASSWLNCRQTGSWRGRYEIMVGVKLSEGREEPWKQKSVTPCETMSSFLVRLTRRRKPQHEVRQIFWLVLFDIACCNCAGFPRDELVFEPKSMCCSSFQQTWVRFSICELEAPACSSCAHLQSWVWTYKANNIRLICKVLDFWWSAKVLQKDHDIHEIEAISSIILILFDICSRIQSPTRPLKGNQKTPRKADGMDVHKLLEPSLKDLNSKDAKKRADAVNQLAALMPEHHLHPITFAKMDGVKALVKLLGNSSATSADKANACMTLGHVAKGNSRLQEIVGAASLPVLAKLLRSEKASAFERNQASYALAHLANRNQRHQMALLKLGVLPDLVQQLRGSTDGDFGSAAYALATIAEGIEKHQTAIRLEGAIGPLVQHLNSSFCPEDRIDAAFCLARLAENHEENQEAILEEEDLEEGLMSLLHSDLLAERINVTCAQGEFGVFWFFRCVPSTPQSHIKLQKTQSEGNTKSPSQKRYTAMMLNDATFRCFNYILTLEAFGQGNVGTFSHCRRLWWSSKSFCWSGCYSLLDSGDGDF